MVDGVAPVAGMLSYQAGCTEMLEAIKDARERDLSEGLRPSHPLFQTQNEERKPSYSKTYFVAHGSVKMHTFGRMAPFKIFKRIRRYKDNGSRSTLMTLVSCKLASHSDVSVEDDDVVSFAQVLAELLLKNGLCRFFQAFDQPVYIEGEGRLQSYGSVFTESIYDVVGHHKIVAGHKLRWWWSREEEHCVGPATVVTFAPEED
ncbi:MAG: hypothetical protein ACREE5_10800 [Acetobacteraceae bacterium]